MHCPERDFDGAEGLAGFIRRRVAKLHAEHGLGGLFHRAARRGIDLVCSTWRRLTCHRSHVFVHGGPIEDAGLPPGLSVMRFESWEHVSNEVCEDLLVYGGRSYVENIRREMADKAVLWLGFLEGQLAGVQMTRLGRDIARWFVPLRDEDMILFAVGTREEHRGKGIAPAIMRCAMDVELRNEGKAYIDCKVWNKPAIRGFEKAGFRRIATMRPLPAARIRR